MGAFFFVGSDRLEDVFSVGGKDLVKVVKIFGKDMGRGKDRNSIFTTYLYQGKRRQDADFGVLVKMVKQKSQIL